MRAKSRILLVDDDPMLLALMRRRLGDRGFDVVACSSGEQAVQNIEDRPDGFDLVLMDVMMPGISGIEALARIRDVHPAACLPVIMLTAREDQETTLEALRSGANDYVTKPPDLEILLARVAVQLQLVEALEALRSSEERYSLAAEGSYDALWDWQPDADRFAASAAWWAALGLADPGPGSLDLWLRRVHPEDRNRVEDALARHLDGQTTRLRIEHRLRTCDDDWRWVLVRGTSRRDSGGRAARMAGSLTDLSEQRLHDPTTGLPLRELLVDRVEASLERKARDGHTAVLSVQFKGLEGIARAWGPTVRDQAFSEGAALLDATARELPGVALRGTGHVTPTELALVTLCRREEDAVRLARRLDEVLGAPVGVAGHSLRLRPRVGVAISDPGAPRTANELLEQAATASRQPAGVAAAPSLYDPNRHSDACRRRARADAGLPGAEPRAQRRDLGLQGGELGHGVEDAVDALVDAALQVLEGLLGALEEGRQRVTALVLGRLLLSLGAGEHVLDRLRDLALEELLAALDDVAQRGEREEALLLLLLLVDDLGERHGREILAGAVVDDPHVDATLHHVGDLVEGDVARPLGVVELAVGVALDDFGGHRPIVGRRDARSQDARKVAPATRSARTCRPRLP